MNTDVDFKSSLDEGYDQCISLYRTVTGPGKEILNRISKLIDSLNSHWIGSDATEHINSMVKICNELGTFTNNTVSAMSETTKSVVNVQAARESNGANGAFVGTTVADSIEVPTKSEIPNTERYFCEKSGARQDYTELAKLTEEFKSYLSTLDSQMAELEENWTSGAKREEALKAFSDFKTSSNKYYQVLTDTAGALDKAISNIEEVD